MSLRTGLSIAIPLAAALLTGSKSMAQTAGQAPAQTAGQAPAQTAGQVPAHIPVRPATVRHDPYREQFRPQTHFSPREKWMNDPNGMVYFQGLYHLFFQFYPGGTTWGPMHWGHAVSSDLMHWKQLPIALFPDSLGYIFSGSAVSDPGNTSGFGRNGKGPLVAIFTQHDPAGEKRGTLDFQQQSIAYSLDAGKTWIKYKYNPVLKNPGIRDFRDPKVFWWAPGKKWVMVLATKDRVSLYSSPDLKSWNKESEFGNDKGAHGGVWECPDLFPLPLDGRTWWVLTVSVNPGGPNGGSGTQYFIGDFDGTCFVSPDDKPKWIDYGPDDYAGVTWGNTGARKIFLGWMSNWDYAAEVPTRSWRSAMTLPRELRLQKVNGEIRLCSQPVKELDKLKSGTTRPHALPARGSGSTDPASGQWMASFQADSVKDFSIVLSNDMGESVTIGFEAAPDGTSPDRTSPDGTSSDGSSPDGTSSGRYYIDRSLSGKIDFHKGFGSRFLAPRLSTESDISLTLVVDAASVELFADGGLTVMTAVFFPQKPFTKVGLSDSGRGGLRQVSHSPLRSIW